MLRVPNRNIHQDYNSITVGYREDLASVTKWSSDDRKRHLLSVEFDSKYNNNDITKIPIPAFLNIFFVNFKMRMDRRFQVAHACCHLIFINFHSLSAYSNQWSG